MTLRMTRVFWAAAPVFVTFIALLGLAGEVEADPGDLWFDDYNFTVSDGFGDGYNDTVTFSYDVDTEANETENGTIDIYIDNIENVTLLNASWDLTVNGTGDEDLNWSWSCMDQTTDRSGNYALFVNLYNESSNITQEGINTTVWLETAEEAWFENKTYMLSDSLKEGYNDTIHWTLPLVTRANHTQEGVVRVMVFNATLGVFDTFDLDFNITGNSSALLYFNWTAGQTGNHSFYIYIYNASTQLLLHYQIHVVELVAFPQDAWFENKTFELFESMREGYNDTINWTFPLVTWDDWTQEGILRIMITNATLGVYDTKDIEFNVTGNSSQPFHFNWTAGLTGNYTFIFNVYNATLELQLHSQTHIVELVAFPQGAWFSSFDCWFEDRLNDTFEDTIHFNFDLATWDNWTQDGWIDITVREVQSGIMVNSSELYYNVTGNVIGDSVEWNWTAQTTDRFSFTLEVYNDSRQIMFDTRLYEYKLEVPYEFAWFDPDIALAEPRYYFVDFAIDIHTWNNWTQEVLLNITVFNGSVPHIEAIHSKEFRTNVTGEDDDPLTWRWTAPEDGDYTFGIWLYNASGELYNSRSYEFDLKNVTDGAWFGQKQIVTRDLHGDGLTETVVLNYDIDTFAEQTQAGYLNIYILNSDDKMVYHNSPGIQFNVTGEIDEQEQWSWTTETNGTFTLYLQLLNETASLVYHEDNLTFSLLAPIEAAWFAYKNYTVANGTVNFTFNIDTWDNWTQEGALFIDVLANGSQLVDNSVLLFSVHGVANNDLLYWNWTAHNSGNYTVAISMVTRDLETTFHNQSHRFQLNVPVIIPNRPPTAFATVMLEGEPATQTDDKLEVELSAAIVFLPANVNDPDGDDLTYAWTIEGHTYVGSDTGDGEGRLSWSFIKGGTYMVMLTVQDGRGGSHSDNVTVVVVRSQPVEDDDDDDESSGWPALIGLVIVGSILVVLIMKLKSKRPD